MADLPTLRASIALAAYGEPLIEGRRVIVFGDASSPLAEQLLERGARLVHVYDPDAMRLAEAATRNTSRNIAFAPLAETGLAVREGAFDVAVIENVAAFADVSSLLKRARKALSARGALLAATPNPEVRTRLLTEPLPTTTALDYYGLYDAVAAEFEQVRMLGQTPFVGYSVVDFAPDGEPEPSFDAGFVPGGAEEPEWFVALAAQHTVRLDDFEIVQLPFRAALESPARPRERAPVVAPAPVVMPPPAPVVDVAPLRAELAALRTELEHRDAWIAQLEARAEAADNRSDEMQAELDQAHSGSEGARRELEEAKRRAATLAERAARADATEKSARRAAEENSAAQVRVGELEAEADQLRSQVAAGQVRARQLEAEVARLSGELAKPRAAEPVDTSAEVVALEAQLAERGAEIRRLQQEIRATERFGRQLLDELEQARSSSPRADEGQLGALGQKLDALASLNAEREADLQAARWTIAGLEARVADGGEAPAADQERLEKDLHQARADLQRLATLVEQLKATKAADGAEAPR